MHEKRASFTYAHTHNSFFIGPIADRETKVEAGADEKKMGDYAIVSMRIRIGSLKASVMPPLENRTVIVLCGC